MAPPNALSMVKSEVSFLLTSMKYASRSNFRSSQDEPKRTLINNLTNLRRQLNEVSSLESLNPLIYLNPFLDVIRSETTTGPITSLALTSVEKFLAYGLLEIRPGTTTGSQNVIGVAMETVAESVIQARFIRSRLSSDEVVLMKIVHLLRTLLLIPAGCLLSNEMVFEILQNCLRICLETQLSELLRRTAEHFLASIVQLFFSRLPSLIALGATQLDYRPDGVDAQNPTEPTSISRQSRRRSRKPTLLSDTPPIDGAVEAQAEEEEHPRGDESICSLKEHLVDRQSTSDQEQQQPTVEELHGPVSFHVEVGQEAQETATVANREEGDEEADPQADISDVHVCRPYNIQAVHNLFALLVGLLNPEQHQESVIKVAMGLLTVALETGADFLHACPSILHLIATDMTKYLMMLLYWERINLFSCTLRVCFLLFESLRVHLKLQLEVYFQRLIALISSENERITYEHREIALDSVVQLFLLPGLAAEVYVNYDCDPYCSNLFEDITEMLTKNAYPTARLMGTHLLALDALLAVIDAIEVQTAGNRLVEASSHSQMPTLPDANRPAPRPNRHWIGLTGIPNHSDLAAQKTKKKILMAGSDRFNINPKNGIAFLQRNGLLSDPLDPNEMATFLAENPRLDKKTIGEYLSSRKNSEVLIAFARNFNFRGTRIDEALRAYLEAFRIPGEAPLIQHLMESFAEQWFQANDAPFANADAAFTLSYAILMLNTDQHNPNSKRQNIPMTVNDFKKNLKGMNGGGQFSPELIEAIYSSIRNNEIVMPSEQTGSVRDNYLWKCLIRRSNQPSFARFIHLPPGHFDADLFIMIWGSTVAALSFIFDKTVDSSIQAKTLAGFVRCARISAYYRMSDVFDNLAISLCKFTMLLSPPETPETLAVAFGRNRKAQLAARLVFALVSAHADIMRDGWRSLLDCLVQLFHAGLLPTALVESADFVETSGKINLFLGRSNRPPSIVGMTNSRSDLGVLGSFYHYLTLGSTPSPPQASVEPPSEASRRLDPMDPPVEVSTHLPGDASPPPTKRSAATAAATSVSSAADLFRLIDEADRSGTSGKNLLTGNDTAADYQQFLQHDEEAAIKSAKSTIAACQIGAVLEESKFLMDESLQELIKALLYGLCGGDKYELTPSPPPSPPTPSPMSFEDTVEALAETPSKVATDVAPVLQPRYFSADAMTQKGQVFCLELLIRVLLYNRDRISLLWPLVRGHLVEILRSARTPCFLVERVVVGMLRLALRLLRRPELTTQIFACLLTILTKRGQYLLRPPPSTRQLATTTRQNRRAHTGRHSTANQGHFVGQDDDNDDVSSSVARQVVCGLAVLLQDSAAELPSTKDWELVFSLLEVCGAGAFPISEGELETLDGHLCVQKKREVVYSSLQDVAVASSDPQTREYASDNEDPQPHTPPSPLSGAGEIPWQQTRHPGHAAGKESWILVGADPDTTANSTARPIASNDEFDLVPSSRLRLPIVIVFQDWFALEKAFNSIVFLVRDPAHITPNNIEYCVHALRVFIEAVLTTPKPSLIRHPNFVGERASMPAFDFPEGRLLDPFTSEVAQQLLDLVYTLFSRAPSIYAEWTKPVDEEVAVVEDGACRPAPPPPPINLECLWSVCWRSLLQAIARLCVDSRREVRSDALAFLQRALLSPILHVMTGSQWEDCLMQVLFPLLTNFLESVTFEEAAMATGASLAANRTPRDLGSQGNLSGVGFLTNIFGGGGADSHQASGGAGAAASLNAAGLGGGITEYADPRMRAIPLLTKIFLQHLNPLYALESFPLLWKRMLTYMEKYIKANISDSLNDAVRESLKNLLLVLYTGTQDTASILVRDAPSGTKEAFLWTQTQAQLATFMPTLMDQLFPPPPPPPSPPSQLPQPPVVTAVEPVESVSSPLPPVSSSIHHQQQQLPPLPSEAVRIQLPLDESDTEIAGAPSHEVSTM
uniref:SEC7 domain-containing protein n=1 Tax=Mesocestoides corti TaxID=53468 RepID=A0A5K3FVB2_MESCO